MHTPTNYIVKLNGQFGVLIKVESGTVYSNQAAGLACEHPQAEGVFISFSASLATKAELLLRPHFHGGGSSLDALTADLTDEALRKLELGFVTVDRNRLSNSFEAWVHVVVKDRDKRLAEYTWNLETEQQIYLADLLSEAEECGGVLVWRNSD